MKDERDADDPLDHEIDFSDSRRNPYFLSVVDPKCVRVLEKNLADLFPDNESVNVALRNVATSRSKDEG